MKKFLKLGFTVILLTIFTSSCEEYLDIPPEASITEQDVFGSYITFQGFLDINYNYILDYNGSTIVVAHNLTGETIATQGFSTAANAANGNYLGLTGGRSNFKFFGSANGIWKNSWDGIRRSNIALEKLNLLVNATQEEKNLIEGQAYFFRAFCHWEIARAYGSIPYIRQTLEAGGNLELPRYYDYKGKFNYQACTEYMVEDLDKAAALLPKNWVGVNGELNNVGRITKGAALALKAKALLYAGSPLMNEASKNSATFDAGYMQRAAEAAAEVLKLDEYTLENFSTYKDIFARIDGQKPFSSETILQRNKNNFGPGEITNLLGRLYLPHATLFGGNPVTEAVTQNFVDIFEMADGTKYIPGGPSQGGYDFENTKRWNNRDPRFRKSIYVDRDKAGIAASTVLEMWQLPQDSPGNTHNKSSMLSPYVVHKFWPVGANAADKQWNNFRFNTPQLRLAEIYLIYAEAVFNATNSATATSSNYGMTALEAVNVVRQRAGAAIVTDLAVYGGDFQKLVKYERDVELCFEGHRWYDLRRWKIKPDPILYRMEFNKDYTTFNREVIKPFIFEDRHYWLPIPIDLTFLYDGFPQNPGW